jgi:cytochrome c oxidase cbb3-type subunit 3
MNAEKKMAEHNPFPGENNTGHVWDENLRELNNNPPSWWMIGFWASVIWWVGYGVLYPMWPMGQQPTKGILGWTQIGEYKDGLKEVDAVRAQHEQKIKSLDAAAVLADPGLRQYAQARGKVLFGDYCAACHGGGGQGNPGYPVLADDDWLYGGGIAKISEAITLGRQGAMPAHVGTLTEQEIDQLSHMVVNLSQGKKADEPALALYRSKGCVACHGPNGDGVLATLPDGTVMTVGAANLLDGIWRFQPGGFESAKRTIAYGVNQVGQPNTREAVMPAFGQTGKLSPDQIKILAAYVHQLGGGK